MPQTFSSIAAAQRFHVVARHKAHALQHGIEVLAVFRLAGEGQRAHGAAVERIIERDDDRLLRTAHRVPGSAHQLQRALNRLGAAVGEEGAIHPRRVAQLLGQQSLILVVIEVGDVDDLGRLIANDLHDARMRMTQRIDAQPGEEIEIALALDAIDVYTLAPRNGQRIAGIGVQQILLFPFDNLLVSRHDDDLAKVLL